LKLIEVTAATCSTRCTGSANTRSARDVMVMNAERTESTESTCTSRTGTAVDPVEIPSTNGDRNREVVEGVVHIGPCAVASETHTPEDVVGLVTEADLATEVNALFDNGGFPHGGF